MKNKTLNLAAGIFLLAIIGGQALGEVDPRGPIAYSGMAVMSDAKGVQVRGYRFRNDGAKPSPWSAHWIWLDGDGPALAGMFRKEITLAEAQQSVKAWLTADLKYCLYVNRRLVTRGPVDIVRDYQGGNTHRWFYDCRDLTPFFAKDANVITAEVFRQSPIWAIVSREQPGFLFEAEIKGGNAEKTTVRPNVTLHSLAALQFSDGTTYDAGNEPARWRLVGFDDSAWPPNHGVNDVWETLVPMPPPEKIILKLPDNLSSKINLLYH